MRTSACHGLHGLQERCARWMLMTLDRVDSDRVAVTKEFLAQLSSVDGSTAASDRQFKTGHHERGGRDQWSFYFVASSVRKSVWTLVRQLRGPHLSTCA
jgi:hypothetical protein